MRRYTFDFNLTELLIAIAIIAVLLSLLLPGLRRFVDKTKLQVCANQQRVLGLHWDLFHEDRGGLLMPLFNYNEEIFKTGIGQKGTSWMDEKPWYQILIKSMDDAATLSNNYINVTPNNSTWRTFVCPTMLERGYMSSGVMKAYLDDNTGIGYIGRGNSWTENTVSYFYNHCMGNDEGTGQWMKVNSIASPKGVVVFAEAIVQHHTTVFSAWKNLYGTWGHHDSLGAGTIASFPKQYYHLLRSNFLMADLSVRSVDIEGAGELKGNREAKRSDSNHAIIGGKARFY